MELRNCWGCDITACVHKTRCLGPGSSERLIALSCASCSFIQAQSLPSEAEAASGKHHRDSVGRHKLFRPLSKVPIRHGLAHDVGSAPVSLDPKLNRKHSSSQSHQHGNSRLVLPFVFINVTKS